MPIPPIPDLPTGILILSVISSLAGIGMVAYLGAKFLEMIGNLRKKEDPKVAAELRKENGVLKDRIENLENLVCRLDQEMNSQVEKAIWMSRSGPSPANSQQMTILHNVTAALESRYQVMQELGRGGMGIVFLAYDKQLKENVAIKVLSPFLSNDPDSVERMRREVTSARKITNGNVIKIYDIAEAGGLYYITMEYFPGENLRQFITRKGPVAFQAGIQIVYQICDGLEAAHNQGIVHRDLKSQNIILNDRGQLKIIDLGLSRTTQLEGMTATGLIMGTPEYMSPEQVMGRRTDERSDLYSLGIILYEIFSGHVPFTGDSAISVGFKHLKESYDPLNVVQPGVPPALSAIIDKLLQKDPAHRFQAVRELRQALQTIQGYAPPLESTERPPQLTVKSLE